MSYEVFARKYRPKTFDDLVGQTHVSRTLKNAVAQNRLAHAYLFVGPRGIGKTSTARILAKSLNCMKGPTVTPCGKCANCVEIAAGNGLDVIEIDGASSRGIDAVRELRDTARSAPAAAPASARGAEGGLRDAESMLDQLVAFCGEKISESDVLNVFGFTSGQTVIDLTGRILRGETPAAIDLLHQQSESGKDMMRLMSDLIAYLRDLLVFKAKPDALKEDVDPDVQKSLAAHAELIATDRLLELIDQFAAAEGRMKWAPNKKLHFEVAIIRAIQTLGQATLDEVIEKLGEIRDDGKITSQKESALVAAGVSPASHNAAAGTAATTAPRVKETAATVDSEKIWEQVLARIPAKSFLRTLSESVRPIGIDGRNFLLGHSPDDKSKIGALASISNRQQLETLLKEATGRDWSVKFVAKDGILPSTAEGPKPAKSFKDDPLIQEAIELFNAQIKS